MIKTLKMLPRTWKSSASLLVCGLVVSASILWGLSEFHEELFEPWLARLDRFVLQTMHGWTSPPMTVLMVALTTVGSVVVLVAVVTITSLWLLWLRRWHEFIPLVVASAGAALLNQLLKLWFHRQRPAVPWALDHEASFSFPSGHAMLGLVCYGMLAYLICRHFHRRPTLLVTVLGGGMLVVGIGISRIYLGVHYPSDILAGFVGGSIWLLSAMLAAEASHRLCPPASSEHHARAGERSGSPEAPRGNGQKNRTRQGQLDTPPYVLPDQRET